ncbi:hypothetical protein LTR86_008802 [Recurvomyces mirabilis]|nr:hypothetical protein LTR86_008802 [Recurvomyces mirabilis]
MQSKAGAVLAGTIQNEIANDPRIEGVLEQVDVLFDWREQTVAKRTANLHAELAAEKRKTANQQDQITKQQDQINHLTAQVTQITAIVLRLRPRQSG